MLIGACLQSYENKWNMVFPFKCWVALENRSDIDMDNYI